MATVRQYVNPSCPDWVEQEIMRVVDGQNRYRDYHREGLKPERGPSTLGPLIFGVVAVSLVGITYYGIKALLSNKRSLEPDDIINILSQIKIPQPTISVQINPEIMASIDQKLYDLSTEVAKVAAVLKGPTLEESTAIQCLISAGGKAGSGVAGAVKTGTVSVWNYFVGK